MDYKYHYWVYSLKNGSRKVITLADYMGDVGDFLIYNEEEFLIEDYAQEFYME